MTDNNSPFSAPPTELPTTEPPITPAKKPMSTTRIVLIVVAAVLVLGAFSVFRFIANAFEAAVDTRVAQAQELEPYVSVAEGFSVEAPGAASLTSNDGTTEGVDYTQNVTVWKDGLYVITTIDFSAYEIEDPELVLESSVSAMEEGMPGATIRESENTTFNGSPAIIGILDIPKQPALRFVVALHNGIQYALIVADFSNDRDENFIDSFRFLD